MVLYSIDDVNENMVLGKSIFLPTGELLLAAGYKLSDKMCKRLKQFGFQTVYIHESGTEDIIPETIISEHVQREMSLSMNKNVIDLQKSFAIKQEGINSIRNIIRDNKQYLQKYLNNSGINNIIEKVVTEILNQPTIVLNMHALQNAGNHLFSHTLAVTITSLALGRKYWFSYEEMKQLAIGSLNYDLGLIALPKAIKKKSSALTPDELELYKQHTVYGYLMLSQNPSITPISAAVALQHHEYQDGSGFPRNLKGENLPPLKDFSRKNIIHRFSEIVAVADIFNKLTDTKLNAHADIKSAMHKIIEMAGSKLNKDVVKSLISIAPVFPVGARIRIVEAPTAQLIGYHGAVAKINQENLETPVIVLYETKNRQRIKPIIIDLSTHKGFNLELIT